MHENTVRVGDTYIIRVGTCKDGGEYGSSRCANDVPTSEFAGELQAELTKAREEKERAKKGLKQGPETRKKNARIDARCAFIHKLMTQDNITSWARIQKACEGQGFRHVATKTLQNTYREWLKRLKTSQP